MSIQPPSRSTSHLSAAQSPLASSTTSILNITTIDTNTRLIRIGNVTVSPANQARSNASAVNLTDSPITPKAFLLANYHSFTIMVPTHWVFNDTYYVFDHWLGNGRANVTTSSLLWQSAFSAPLPNGLSNSTVVFTSSSEGVSGANVTKTTSNAGQDNNSSLIAVYRPLPDSVYNAYITFAKYLPYFDGNNTSVTLVEGERCCEPAGGLLKVVKIYPDHVIINATIWGIFRYTAPIELHLGQSVSGSGCSIRSVLTLITIQNSSAAFVKHRGVAPCAT